MSSLNVPSVAPTPESRDLNALWAYVEQLSDLYAMAFKEMDWFANGNISSQNVRNIAGFNVSEYELRHKSGIVGMSGFDPMNPEAVRFWSGNEDKELASWLVRQKGLMEAVGAIIKSSTGYPRIEFDGTTGVFSVYQSADSFFKLAPDAFGSTPGFVFQNGADVAALMYLLSTASVQSLFIGTPAGSADIDISSGKDLKLTGTNAIANGSWTFNQTINGSITGHAASADYADHAGTASAADELSPSGEISWGQVLKSGSNVADLETKNLSSLTQNSSYRTVSDAEKSTWNGKANKTQPAFIAPTLQNGWNNFGSGYENAGYYLDEFGYLHITGMIKSGTTTIGTILFNLPAGYRPSSIALRNIQSNNGTNMTTSIEFRVNGDVAITSTAGNTWMIFEDVRVRL